MQQRSENTHQNILGAARRLFAQSGYAAAGVAEICAAAGVSKGAFYHHFPSKQAVFLALLDEWLAGLDQAFAAARLQEQDVPQAMLRMAEMAGGVLRSSDANLTIILEFWLQASRDPAVWQAAIAPYRRYNAYFAGLLQEGIAQGALRPVDPAQAGRATVALALGLLLQALFDPQGADWVQETPLSLGLLLDGLVCRTG